MEQEGDLVELEKAKVEKGLGIQVGDVLKFSTPTGEQGEQGK